MDRLAPCIRYNPKTWGYIKDYLLTLGYKVFDAFLTEGDIIVTNYCNEPGLVTNLSPDYNSGGRKLIIDVNEFLNEAKKYMNREFIKEDLKSGMLVKYSGHLCLVIDSYQGLCISGKKYWSLVENMDWNQVTKVWAVSHPSDAYKLEIGNRICLYEKKVEKVLTMQEIADKFGISVEQLRIKE